MNIKLNIGDNWPSRYTHNLPIRLNNTPTQLIPRVINPYLCISDLKGISEASYPRDEKSRC